MGTNNTIQRRTQETAAARTSEGPTMQQYIKQMQGEIKKALPAVMTPERFSRSWRRPLRNPSWGL